MSYINNFKNIEKFSKKIWDSLDVYNTQIDDSKEKKIVLDFFPYPSGSGLHVGHTLGYIATDIYSRFHRLKGKNVLHAMGYDAFGLPAEQYAVENNEHPSVITYKNIDNIKSQLKFLGLDHDEKRTFNTCDVEYYKWTQHIFLLLYNSYFDEEENKAKHIDYLILKLRKDGLSKEAIDIIVKNNRLAYLDEIKVNWCPKLGTVLSNEEVIGGLSERGSYPVVSKPLKQWVLRITKYAKRLIDNLQNLDWPISVKEMQKNWIGISKGHEISFKCENDVILTVYSTRLETLNGVTFLAISREHKNLKKFFNDEEIKKILSLSELFNPIKSNIKAIHPITKKELPIFVADYVLNYGTCALMGVPAHDFRDYEFAQKNNLDIIAVIRPDIEYFEKNNLSFNDYLNNTQNYPCYCENNYLINGNRDVDEIENLEKEDFVEKRTYTKIRDWVFSRQRYWGEPIPMVIDKQGNPHALHESCLPVELPYLEIIKKEIVSDKISKPLDDCINWKNIKFIKIDDYSVKIIKNDLEANGKEIFEGTRETNTMPNWAGSCWYYLRYMDNKNEHMLIGKEAKEYWEKSKNIGCVDLYLGGAEHAVLHLLYARFWHMVLYDLGYLNSKEPFQRLFNQGMILGPSYQNSQGKYFHYKDVQKKENKWFSKSSNEELIQNIGKIGKRYKNGVSPEEICNEYSIDALRLYMMYLGPLEQNKPWEFKAIKGMVKVLNKVYLLDVQENFQDSVKIKNEFNLMLEKIEKDFELLKFNTAIAAFIIFLNQLSTVSLELYLKILVIFSPIAPHLSEYLYHYKCKKDPNSSIITQKWPDFYDNIDYKESSKKLIISINGKKTKELIVNINSDNIQLDNITKQYCLEKNIKFEKIIIPNSNKKAFFANIVTIN